MGNRIDVTDWERSIHESDDRARARFALDLAGYTDVDLDNLPGFTDAEIDAIAYRLHAHEMEQH